MTARRHLLLAFALLVAVPVVVSASIQQQRAQILVSITINVTPDPLGLAAPSGAAATSGNGIVANLTLRNHQLPGGFSAESLAFEPSDMVAQNQKAVEVEAEISPNPSGTLLYSDQSGVIINQTAGTTQTYTCEYHVSVDTTITNWSLDHGLYSNFSGSAGSFAGNDLSNNSHIATPLPQYTPFAVYSNGQNWALLQANGGAKTYCVDLKVTIPAATAQGSYSSNAVYTLLY